MEQYIEFIGNHVFLSSAFVAVLILLIRAEILHQTEKTIQLDPVAATRLMNSEEPVVLDVRDATDFGKAHIRDAVNIPLSSLKGKIAEIVPDKAKPVLVYCNSGNISVKACRMLTRAGYSSVRHISGGLASWQDANLPVTRGSGKKKSSKKNA